MDVSSAYGVSGRVVLLFLVAIALGLYLILRGRMPLWLLVPLIVVLAPIGALLLVSAVIHFYTVTASP